MVTVPLGKSDCTDSFISAPKFNLSYAINLGGSWFRTDIVERIFQASPWEDTRCEAGDEKYRTRGYMHYFDVKGKHISTHWSTGDWSYREYMSQTRVKSHKH